jgi:hypothetical protein
MKHFAFIMVVMLVLSSFGIAEDQITEQLAKLQQAHQKAIQNFGHLLLRNGKFSFAVVGKDIVSIVRGDSEMSFYTEVGSKKLYTHLQLQAGERDSELTFVFDNKITINENTYNLKYKMTYTLGEKMGYIIATENVRWNVEKCWSCVKCAGDNIMALYTAYKECGTDWQCWITKYQTLINLYYCVKDNCISCFKD